MTGRFCVPFCCRALTVDLCDGTFTGTFVPTVVDEGVLFLAHAALIVDFFLGRDVFASRFCFCMEIAGVELFELFSGTAGEMPDAGCFFPDALVLGAAEFEGEVLFFLDEFAVDDVVEAVEYSLRVLRPFFSVRHLQILVEKIAAPRPDVLSGERAFYFLEERGERLLVLLLERFPAKDGKPRYVRRREEREDFFFRLRGERLAV